MDTSLDGNAAAGTLGDLFAFDITMAVSTCATCRDARRIAELRASGRPRHRVVLRLLWCRAAPPRALG